jgi:aspartyl-tRNA(Asn)/glutamyl-tRNA(Gln) amidotransferase subunit B
MVAPTNKLIGLFGQLGGLVNVKILLPLVVEAKGLKQISDSGALETIIDQVLAANQKSVEEFRAGKEKAFNALIGQIMKATQGKANPQQVNKLLTDKLNQS